MKLLRPLATVLLSLMICVSILAQNLTFQGRVIEVIDGTTVVVQTQSKSLFKIRCLGAVAPDKQQSFGSESQRRLSSLVFGELVTVTSNKHDENGNLLGTIRLNNEDVCLDQLRSGLAWLDSNQALGLTSSERSVYITTEAVARNQSVGLWRANTQTASAPITSNSRPLSTANSTASTVDVRDYTRNDGTFVYRRNPPNGQLNTSSTSGNVDPFIGKPGNRSWFQRNWWIFPTIGALIGAGYLVHRYSDNNPGGLGILCNDGTVSQAQHRQGACSHHGGIR